MVGTNPIFLVCITPSMVELIPRRFPNPGQINKKNVPDSILPTPTPREKHFKFIVPIVIAKEGHPPSENHKDFSHACVWETLQQNWEGQGDTPL